MISNGALPPGQRPAHGTLVAPQVYGPNHQHIFCARLDMMIDGPGNTSRVRLGGPAARPGQPARQRVGGPADAGDQGVGGGPLADGRTARHWRIINPNRRNGLGEPVGYRLVPQDSVLPFGLPGSNAMRRAQFATRHLWVTAYHPEHRFPAGEYPNQHRPPPAPRHVRLSAEDPKLMTASG